jgi:hypothetical protein
VSITIINAGEPGVQVKVTSSRTDITPRTTLERDARALKDGLDIASARTFRFKTDEASHEVWVAWLDLEPYVHQDFKTFFCQALARYRQEQT